MSALCSRNETSRFNLILIILDPSNSLLVGAQNLTGKGLRSTSYFPSNTKYPLHPVDLLALTGLLDVQILTGSPVGSIL